MPDQFGKAECDADGPQFEEVEIVSSGAESLERATRPDLGQKRIRRLALLERVAEDYRKSRATVHAESVQTAGLYWATFNGVVANSFRPSGAGQNIRASCAHDGRSCVWL
jgi:hypothetical protein